MKVSTIIAIAIEVLAIIGCIDIIKSKKIKSILLKILFVILLLATNIVGVLVHYLYGKSHL